MLIALAIASAPVMADRAGLLGADAPPQLRRALPALAARQGQAWCRGPVGATDRDEPGGRVGPGVSAPLSPWRLPLAVHGPAGVVLDWALTLAPDGEGVAEHRRCAPNGV